MADRWLATALSLVTALLLLLFVPSTNLKASEVHLTSAQIIGAAFALVLTLSIIPAQRAAEAFSTAILGLYARDRGLVLAFLILAATTMSSVLLGSGWLPSFDRYAIALQLVLLGISFDALRRFFVRVLALLAPQTAVGLVVRACASQIAEARRTVQRLARISAVAAGQRDGLPAVRAALFKRTGIVPAVLLWIRQLDEFARKAIARRDTQAATEVLRGMGQIGIGYCEARRDSLILLPDVNNLFAGGVSDIQDVLGPTHESIVEICKDAVKHSNEAVVAECVVVLGEAVAHSMGMIYALDRRPPTAPLAFASAFHFTLCVEAVTSAGMADAGLRGISTLGRLLLRTNTEVDAHYAEDKLLEALFTFAAASYVKPDSTQCRVWAFPAAAAMLQAVRHEIQQSGYLNRGMFKTVLDYLSAMIPFEVNAEVLGKRQLQTFPPYDLSLETSIPSLLNEVAKRIQVDANRPWTNPFDDFLHASERVQSHFRGLSNIDFKNTLLRKWAFDTLMMTTRVHSNLLVQPLAGTERYLVNVREDLSALVYKAAGLFPTQQEFPASHADDAADDLAGLGLHALKMGWPEVSRACADAIATIAKNSAALKPHPFTLADFHQKLEIVARGADALDEPAFANQLRQMIQKPPNVADDDWPHFLEARQTRLRQLDEQLRAAGRDRLRLEDSAVDALHRLLAKAE